MGRVALGSVGTMNAAENRRPTVLVAGPAGRTERYEEWLDDHYHVRTSIIEDVTSLDASVTVTLVDLTEMRAIDPDALEPTGRTILVGSRSKHYDIQFSQSPSQTELRMTVARLIHRDIVSALLGELFEISHSKARIEPAHRPTQSGIDIHRHLEDEFDLLARLANRSSAHLDAADFLDLYVDLESE